MWGFSYTKKSQSTYGLTLHLPKFTSKATPISGEIVVSQHDLRQRRALKLSGFERFEVVRTTFHWEWLKGELNANQSDYSFNPLPAIIRFNIVSKPNATIINTMLP